MTNKIKNLLNLIKQTLYSKFLTNKNIFYYIYKNNFWKYKESRSGQGSQGEYLDFTVNLVKKEKKIIGKTVCDIGCGDFNFGSKIYKDTKKYIALDIVDFLIEENKKKFTSQLLEFKVLDVVNEEIPTADVYIIRQVFQHLRNKDISKIIKKILKNKPERIIVFEDVPKCEFFANKEIRGEGFFTRHEYNSGVDLTTKPFENNDFKKTNEFESSEDNINSKLVCYEYSKN